MLAEFRQQKKEVNIAVPKSKRGESKLMYYYYSLRLTDAITMFLMKDFGMKMHTKDIQTATYNAKMSKEDTTAFKNICGRYGIDVVVNYPNWLMDNFRNMILADLD